MFARKSNVIAITLAGLIAIGLILLPFLSNGVFFEHGRFVLDAVLLGAEFVIVGMMLIKPQFRHFILQGDGFRYGDLAIAVFTILYLLGILYAASLNLAVDGALDAIALLVPYFLMRFTTLRKLFAPWMGLGFVLASVAINVIGLANGWGQLTYPSATESTAQGQLEIASVFQYHNAYAAFTASIATGLFVWAARTRCRWQRAIAMGIASLNVAGVILSGSRGALVLWFLVMILALIGLRNAGETRHEIRNRFLANVYIAAIGAVIGYLCIHHAIQHKTAIFGWIGMVLAVIIPIVCVMARGLFARNRTLLHGDRGFWIWIGIGVVIGILGAAVKSHALLAKIHSYNFQQMSVAQRFIFWKDGLKIVGRNPISGSGSGAWQAMYQSVQSYPYLSNKVHSFGVNTLIEVGILGFLCLVALVWPLIRNVVWPSLQNIHEDKITAVQFAWIAAGLMLFVHSLMDWDMGFEYLQLLFFAAVGATASFTRPFAFRSKPAIRISRVSTAGLGVFALAGFLVTMGGLRSEAIASYATKNPTFATSLFRSAYRLSPYNDSYLADAAISLLRQQKVSKGDEQTAERWIQAVERINPYSASIASESAHLTYALGHDDFAFAQAVTAYTNAPYIPSYASLALTTGTVDALMTAQSDPTQARRIFQQVNSLYGQIQQNASVVSALPSYLPPSQPYLLDPFSIVSVSAAKYVLGDATNASALANSEVNATKTHTKELAELIVLMCKDGVSGQDVVEYVKGHSSVQSSYQLLVKAVARG